MKKKNQNETEKLKQKKQDRKRKVEKSAGNRPKRTEKKRKSRKGLVRGIFMGRPVWKIAKRIGTRRAANRR
jgi:hypothetical protein